MAILISRALPAAELFFYMKRLVLLTLCAAMAIGAAQTVSAPSVSKVEPPDWAVESKPVTLRMLITGANLAGASVRAAFRVTRSHTSATGTHLFFDLTIPASARPGSYPLHIETPAGAVDASFSVEPALTSQGRFRGFSSDDVIYLLMPDRFANGDSANDDPAISRGLFDRAKSRFYHGGDLEGIRLHLPYLKALGVTAIWTTPVYDNSNRLNEREKYDGQAITDYHGYGAVDLYAADEHFGTLRDYRRLIDDAHSLGIRVIQDEVANHTGPYHPWVTDPPTPTWFHGTESRHLNETWRIWTLMDPHATAESRKSTLDGWFADILPDLNQDDPECARYLIQNTLWWLSRTGLDGIREDTLPYAPRSFWRDWTAAIRARFPAVNVVGEVYDTDPALVSSFQAGRKFEGVDTGVDTLFDFPLNAAIRKFFSGKGTATDLLKVLAHDSLYPDPSRLVVFAGLHDMPRFLNEPGATVESLKNAFTFLLTVRGIPMIYYGDEVALRGGEDPDNRRDFPGGWKDDPRNAFEVSGRTPEQQSLVEHLQRVAAIRKELEPLRRGGLKETFAAENQFSFARTTAKQSVIVAFNRADSESRLRIPLAGLQVKNGARYRDALGSGTATAQEGFLEIKVPAGSAAIYR